MGTALQIISLAGTATSAFGQFQTGQNAKDVYDYNQQIAKYQSKAAQDRGELEVEALERNVSKVLARKRALAGKSGTATDVGSNLDSLIATRKEADIDANLIRYNADLESYSANQQASLYGAQGQQFAQAGFLNAGATLLGGVSKFDFKKKKSPLVNFPNVSTVRGGAGGGYGF